MKISIARVCTFLFFLSLQLQLKAQSADYKAQTLFIYNFIKYVNWADAVGENFRVAVYGNSPIVEELKKLASLKKATGGKPIQVFQINAISQEDNYELIYVVDSKSKEIRAIADAMKSKPTLIVAQREGLVKKGAAIDFVTLDDDKLSFQVSRVTIQNHNLKISGELLRLAILAD
jgi:YfiR/HmsC-like